MQHLPKRRPPMRLPPRRHPHRRHPPRRHPHRRHPPMRHPPTRHPPRRHPPTRHPPRRHPPRRHPPRRHPPMPASTQAASTATASNPTTGSTTAETATTSNTTSTTSDSSTAQQTTTQQPTTQPSTNGSTVVTTAKPSKTTAPIPTTGPTTTVAPSLSPTDNKYTFVKNNVTCLKVDMKSYFEQNGITIANVTALYKMDKTKSSCNVLTVGYKSNTFSLTFSMDDKNASFYLSDVEASINKVKANASNIVVGKAAVKASYSCASGIVVKMSNNVTMVMDSVQYQAFKVVNGNFGTAQICTGDMGDNVIIPIAVGCALGGLIIIVIVAYLIGRRRMKHRYEAM
uniref:Lysosome-associated membrane glycoprotein 5 n=1 Tax=Ciona savignyi TaxID=51511 RepID=H2YJ47_CIOSA